MTNKLQVGVIGLSAERGWASTAHMPAFRALARDMEFVGTANTSRASAEAAAKALGMGRAFDSVDSLVACPDIDAVVVTVKVRHHRDLVARVLEAGKHVLCEWPLASNLAEAQELAALAKRQRAIAAIGTQAVVSPEILFLRDLVAEGYLGDLRSATFLGSGYTWGDDVIKGDAYAMDPKNGATLLSVVAGHAFSALQCVLGPISKIGGHLTQRQFSTRIEDTGETIPMLTPDQMVAAGEFANGVPFSFQLRGGLPCGARLFWEIGGSERDLRVTSQPENLPLINSSVLRIESCRRGRTDHAELRVPSSYYLEFDGMPAIARNVAHLYRLLIDDIRNGTRTAPDFDHAVALHKLLDDFGTTPIAAQHSQTS